MQSPFADFVRRHKPLIEGSLREHLPASQFRHARRLNEAIEYAVMSGGKRMRPLLVLIAAELCGGRPERTLRVAAGLEYLHVSSLIFDDLPAMDDAPVRRGAPAVHVVFGEDVAMLAGLALLNHAHACFAGVPGLVRKAAAAIGPQGMIGGQAADLTGAAGDERMAKTTAMMRLTLAAGAMAAGAGARRVAAVERFGELAGEAYQVCDDLLDVLAHEGRAGKTTGQDLRHRRHNTGIELGIRRAWTRAEALIQEAERTVDAEFGVCSGARLLMEAARSITANVAGLVYEYDLEHSGGLAAGGGCGERVALAPRQAATGNAAGAPLGADSGA